MREPRLIACTLLLLVSVSASSTARGDIAGSAVFSVTIDLLGTPSTPPYDYPSTGSVTWNSESRDVLGLSTVDLGASVGSGTLDGDSQTGTGTPPSGVFRSAFTSTSAGVLSYEILLGDAVCASGECPISPGSSNPSFHYFVGDLSSLSGSIVGSDPGDLPTTGSGGETIVYTVDGYAECDASAGTTIDCDGDASLNAFQAEPTATGSPVTVSSSPTFFHPGAGAEITVDVDVTYDTVSTSGETTVTGVSNAAGGISSNFAVAIGSFLATFFDIETDAGVSGPIRVCGSYSDETYECSYRILHREGGVFVDKTLAKTDLACPFAPADMTCSGSPDPCTDTTNNEICAEVTSLSPFVIAVEVAAVPAASLGGLALSFAIVMTLGALALRRRRV